MQAHENTATNTTDIATNTANIATNAADIATINTTLADKVTGPASATDNAMARFDGTTGKVVQNSDITLGDSDGKLTRTAGISISGTNTNDSAASGYVGEFSSASATTGTLTTNVATNITSLALGAGDWDITAGYSASGSSTPLVTDIWVSINTVTATGVNTAGQNFRIRGTTLTDPVAAGTLGPLRVSLTGSTTYYLNTTCVYTGGGATFAVSGIIRARRVR
jgi:hypothetical protein